MKGPFVAIEKYKLFTVIPTVQATPDYSAGDVLFAPTEIANIFPDAGASCILKSITIIDKQIVGTHDFTLYFTYSSTALGTINATADISDADLAALNLNGVMHMDLSAARTTQLDNAQVIKVLSLSASQEAGYPMLIQAADDSTTVYIQGIVRTGTPTFAASDITLIFHIEYR